MNSIQYSKWCDENGFEELDSESDKGYCDRVKAIQLFMEKCDD